MNQITLFDTGIKCSHCNTDPGIGTNGNLFDGFFDSDTKQNVCWACRETHYKQKGAGEHAGKYSETPLMISMQIHQRRQNY